MRAWYLTLPTDPTNENRKWLQELTEGASFPCEWRSLSYLEGLVSKYPEVVDYYLHDGRERLEDAIIELTKVLGLQQRSNPDGAGAGSTATRLEPAEIREGLTALHKSLNRHDPHYYYYYYYDFSVDTSRPDISEAPNLVAAVQEGDAHRCITFKIFSRFNEAVVERPVPISFSIDVESGSQLERDLEDFQRYGRPFQAPLGTTTIRADLPGGLGGTLSLASINVGPSRSNQGSYELHLAVLDEAGVVLSETLMVMQPPTTGVSGQGQGLRVFGSETAGAFTLEILSDFQTGVVKFSLKRGDISGKIPATLLPGLAVLSEARPPHQLRIRQAYGPPSGSPLPIPDAVGLDDAGFILDLVEALVTIQEFTTKRVTIPDLTAFTGRDAREVVDVARLLRGDKLTRDWNDLKVPLRPGESIDERDIFQAVLREPISIVLNGAQIDLGIKETYLVAVRLDATWRADGDEPQVRLVPVGKSPAVIRLLRDVP